MITVHHLDNSRSQRILWLLEELELEYDIVFYKRRPDFQAPPELRKVHPLGKAPVITDGETVIAETGAIVEHILETYGAGRLLPEPGTPERQRLTYWLYYAEGSAMSPLLLKLIFSALPQKTPFFIRPVAKTIAKTVQKKLIDPQLQTHLDYWEAELKRWPWFAGDRFTAADIVMSFPLEAAASRAGAAERPEIAAFLKAIHGRPAYQRALKRGGDYAYASVAA